MNPLSKTFLLIGSLGLAGTICLEMELVKIGCFFVIAAGLSFVMAPAVVMMFED